MLASVGVVVTAVLVAVPAHLWGLDWPQALLLGAVVSSTDAAAVFAVLRGGGLQLKRRVGVTLEIESGINDPVAVILTTSLTYNLLLGEGRVELLAALGEDTPVGRFLARRGPGLHHVAFAVEDVGTAVRELADSGTNVIDLEPRRGLGGHLVSFVHPESVHGVLVEVIEHG